MLIVIDNCVYLMSDVKMLGGNSIYITSEKRLVQHAEVSFK